VERGDRGDVPITSSCVGNNPLTRLSNSVSCPVSPGPDARQHDSSVLVTGWRTPLGSFRILFVAHSRKTDSTSVIPGAMACVLRGAEGSRGEKILWKDMQSAGVGWEEGEMNGNVRAAGGRAGKVREAGGMGHVIWQVRLSDCLPHS
jgi:hypothetical protein